MKKAPSIFFFLGSFKLGGTERTASRVGLELMERGYNVKFILLYGIFDYDIPELKQNSFVLIEKSNSRKIVAFLKAYWRLMGILLRYRPKYLVSCSLLFNTFSFLTFYPRIVFRIESNIFHYKRRLYRRYIQRYIALSPNVRKIVIPSKGLFDASLNYFHVKKKLTLVPNPVNVEEIRAAAKLEQNNFIRQNKGRYIVTAGRLHESKGVQQLVEVFAKSALKGQYKLVILGEGPELATLKQRAIDLGIAGQVLFTGFVNNPYCYYTNSRYFVLNSDHESFGNVIIESMACGIPTLSNDCDFGPRSIITNQVDGILYNKKNEEEFKQWMERLAFDDDFYNKLKAATSISVQKFAASTIADYWVTQVLKTEKISREH